MEKQGCRDIRPIHQRLLQGHHAVETKSFKLPSGEAGNALFFANSLACSKPIRTAQLEGIVLQAAMVMPVLLLQKPHPKSKAKEHTQHHVRRLQLWIYGNINSLMNKDRTLQLQFIKNNNIEQKSTQQTTKIFAKLMMEGKVRAALRLLAKDNGGGDSLIESNTTPKKVREVLMKKHSPKQSPKPSSIVTPEISITEHHPILFDEIDGQLIRSTVLKMDGATGPLGLNAAASKRLYTSFKTA